MSMFRCATLFRSGNRALQRRGFTRQAPPPLPPPKAPPFSFSLYVNPALAFTKFPKYSGHRKVLGALFGMNAAVYLAWQQRGHDDPLMTKMFLWDQRWRQEGRYWILVTPSFSHTDFGHIVGNMTLFLYLGKPLCQFMGPHRFVALYFLGAAAGTLASDLSPGYKEEHIASTEMRYVNLLQEASFPGCQYSLGASDAVMAYVAAFYLIFPRRQVHLFRMMHVLRRLRGTSSTAASLRMPVLTKMNLVAPLTWRVSAMWLLPIYFLGDFTGFFASVKVGGPMAASGTNHMAHVGGFAAGSLFHLLVTSPLKKRYFKLPGFDVRRWYLMAVSLALIGLPQYYQSIAELQEDPEQHQAIISAACTNVRKILVDDTNEDRMNDEEKQRRKWINKLPPLIHDALEDASICAMEEHVQNLIKQEDNAEKGLTVVLEECGNCDKEFIAVAKAIHAVVDASRRVGGDAGLSSSTEGGGKEEERPPLTHRELQELVMESLDGRTMDPKQAERLFKHLASDARRAAAAKAAAADAVAAAKAAQIAARSSNNADKKAAAAKALEDAEAKQRAVEMKYTSADDTDYSNSILAVFLLSVMAAGVGVGIAALEDD